MEKSSALLEACMILMPDHFTHEDNSADWE